MVHNATLEAVMETIKYTHAISKLPIRQQGQAKIENEGEVIKDRWMADWLWVDEPIRR